MEYTVERILDARTENGRREYYLRWKGYPAIVNSWEPVEHLNCVDLIARFEESLKAKTSIEDDKSKASVSTLAKRKAQISNEEGISPKSGEIPKEDTTVSEEQNDNPAETILEPLKILAVSESGGNLVFLIQWKGDDRSDLVPAKVANIKWPQMVIKFYEDRIIWHD